MMMRGESKVVFYPGNMQVAGDWLEEQGKLLDWW